MVEIEVDDYQQCCYFQQQVGICDLGVDVDVEDVQQVVEGNDCQGYGLCIEVGVEGSVQVSCCVGGEYWWDEQQYCQYCEEGGVVG